MKKILVLLAVLFSPVISFAATTVHYTCDNTLSSGGVSCYDDVFSFDSSLFPTNQLVSRNQNELPTAGDWYISFTSDNPSSEFYVIDVQGGEPDSSNKVVGSASDFMFTTLASPDGLFLISSGTPANISDLCVSDTVGACSGSSAASPSVVSFARIFPSLTASSTQVAVIDIPNLDLALIFFSFYAVFVLVVWFFRRK